MHHACLMMTNNPRKISCQVFFVPGMGMNLWGVSSLYIIRKVY